MVASCFQLMTSAFSILLPCPYIVVTDRKRRSMPRFHMCRSSQGLSDHHQSEGNKGWDLSADMSHSMVRKLILVNWEILKKKKKIDWSVEWEKRPGLYQSVNMWMRVSKPSSLREALGLSVTQRMPAGVAGCQPTALRK